MKPGDIIVLTDAEKIVCLEHQERADTAHQAMMIASRDSLRANRSLWRFIREAHPEGDEFELVFESDTKTLVVGTRK